MKHAPIAEPSRADHVAAACPAGHLMLRCPLCSSSFVQLVIPSWWQRPLLGFTSKRPVSCWHCGWHGWVEPEPVAPAPGTAPLPGERSPTSTPGEAGQAGSAGTEAKRAADALVVPAPPSGGNRKRLND